MLLRKPWTLLALSGVSLFGCYQGDAPAIETAAETEAVDEASLHEVSELDPSDPRITSLAEDEGVSIEEARRRIRLQDTAEPVVPIVAEQLSDRFGGAWFDDNTGRLKIGVVDSDEAPVSPRSITAIRSATIEADTDVVSVRHSAAELDAVIEALAADWQVINADAPSHVGMMIDPTTNSVTLSIPEGPLTPEQTGFVEAAQQTYGSMIVLQHIQGDGIGRLEHCSGVNCDPPLRGGTRLVFFPPGEDFTTCTLGFIARAKGDPRWFGITAGHCLGGKAEHYTASKGGITVGRTYKKAAKGDSGLVTIDSPSTWNPKPWVLVKKSANTTENESYPIKKAGTALVGTRVCKTGTTTKTTCGKVTGYNVFFRGQGGYVQTTTCSDYGDSGAPVFAGNTAYGVHVGSAGGCSAFFDPIARVLHNLTVRLETL